MGLPCRLTRVTRRALAENKSVAEIVLVAGLLTEAELENLLQLEAMTRPSRAKDVAAMRLTQRS